MSKKVLAPLAVVKVVTRSATALTTMVSVRLSPAELKSSSTAVAAVVVLVIVLPAWSKSTVPSSVSVALAPLAKKPMSQTPVPES